MPTLFIAVGLLTMSDGAAAAATLPTTIHVPTSDGALAAALARVASLPRAAGERIELLLEGGVHHVNETLMLDVRHHDLTLKRADPASEAVISGGLRIPPTAWSLYKQNIIVANVNGLPPGTVPRQLFTANGKVRATRARHPNLYAADGCTTRERPYLYWSRPICDTKANHSKACASASQRGFHWNASDDAWFDAIRGDDDVEAVVYHGWTASRNYVSGVSSDGRRTLTFSNPSERPIGFWRGLSSEGGQRYVLENSLALLDAPGEFYLDGRRSRLYYYPLPGEAHRNGSAYLPLVDEILVADGTSNLIVDGIALRHADWTCGGASRDLPCDGQSVEWQDHAAVHIRHTANVSFRQMEVSSVGPAALWIDEGSDDTIVEQSRFTNLGTGAVRIGAPSRNAAFHPNRTWPAPPPRRVTLSDSLLSDGSQVFPGGTAVLVQFAESASIVHNEIANFSYTGISLGWTWNYRPQLSSLHELAHNYIHHLGFPRRETGDAMACIYTLGQLNGSHVHDNVCHDVRAYMSGGYCLSQDQGSSNLLFERNVCLRTTGSPQNTHYGDNVTYRNNIFYAGYYDTWTDGCPAAALRTSPNRRSAVAPYPAGAVPDRLRFEHNLVGLVDNASALLFEGDWRTDNRTAPPATSFAFERNLYWAANAFRDLRTARAFGGVTKRVKHEGAYQLAWGEWQASGHDAQGGIGDPQFLDGTWDQPPFNVTLAKDSPAWALGWEHIDTSDVGVRT